MTIERRESAGECGLALGSPDISMLTKDPTGREEHLIRHEGAEACSEDCGQKRDETPMSHDPSEKGHGFTFDPGAKANRPQAVFGDQTIKIHYPALAPGDILARISSSLATMTASIFSWMPRISNSARKLT